MASMREKIQRNATPAGGRGLGFQLGGARGAGGGPGDFLDEPEGVLGDDVGAPAGGNNLAYKRGEGVVLQGELPPVTFEEE
ncbi:hypothetical protein N7452_001141 [Penicillium brevicompactum]|uniref:Uncharacterized protein n=1 Tax=Penicillium brevicompactum TaxID=5074 RepID=A0A9W9UP84_PENBR|nr:hypothetical protein N7452_001141 [Penicillium brevicompactum]